MPEILGDRDVGLLKLLQQSYAARTPLAEGRADLVWVPRAAARTTALARGWHGAPGDQKGTAGHASARRLGVDLQSFDDYVAFLEHFVDTLADRHQVALKSALAY